MNKVDIGKLKKGDAKYYECLVNSRYGLLYTIACKWCADISVAQEIVQDVFISLWEHKSNLKDDVNIDAYLVTSIKHRAIDIHRKDKRTKIRLEEFYNHSLLETWIENSAISNLSVKEIKLKVYSVGCKLPPLTRRIFYMSRYYQMNYGEIAESLQLSVKSIEYHISKALHFFKKNLNRTS